MKQITKNLRWLLASLLLVVGMSSAWADEETIDFSAQGYTNAQQVTETSGTVVKATFTSGGTATAYYTTGNAVRVYNGGTMTITANGNEITKIVYTYELNGTATASVAGKNNAGTYNTSTKTWTGSDTEVVLTAGTAKHVRISKVVVTYTVSGGGSDPSISADNVDVAYNATSGQIAYTVNNPVTGGSVSATTTADWITLSSTTTSPIAFTCTANSGASARTATVTLTYTYGSNTATKSVTVAQAGNPNIVNNISDITAAGTYTVRGTIVAKNTRGFIVGDGTGYVYYYNQSYDQSAYNIGDKVKLSGSVVVYGGVYEFNSSTTVTAATESNYVEENPTVLSGADMDSRVASTTPAQLSSYVQYEGTLSVSTSGSNTYYNITSIDGATTAQGSISYPISTDFTSLNGQTVTVKGYYVGVSSSKYYSTMLGSIEAAAGFVAAPTFDPAEGEYSEAQEVTITSATEGASIYYTLDGSDPTTSSTAYTGPVTISTTTTLKAIATDGTNVSEITSAIYTIDTRTELFINEFYQDGTGNSIPAESTITITVGETPEFTRAYPTLANGVGVRLTQGEIVYTGDNDALGTVDPVSGEITLVAGATGTLTVTATFAGNTTYKPCTGFYKLKVKQEEVTPTGTGDEITHDFVGVSGTTYTSWSDKTGTSGAVYAGKTAGGNEAVQMRTTGSDCGIVTTTSGGKVTFVTVEWNENTSGSRTLDIYGSNTAYTSAADLYDSATQGTLLGSICVDNATQLAITGDYAYIGIRSHEGALWCDKITIYWDNPSGKQDPQLAYDPTNYSITEGDAFTTPELSNPHELTVTYTGDNDDLATVDAATGELTFVSGAAGEITVTATFEGDNTYNAGSASYTLTVYAQASGDELFNETFAGFAGEGGRDDKYTGSVGAGSTATGTDEEGWTFERCGAASSCLKFGTSNANGVFTTRSIALTGSGTLTFSVAGWGTGTNNTLAVTAEGGTLDGETEIALTNGDWTDHTVYINDAEGELVLTFTGKRGFIDDIKVVSTTSDPRTATTVTLDPATTSYNVILGDAFTAPTATLDPATAGTLTYESSDETVATVDATGAVEILAAGTTTITAKFEGSEDYKPSQASYTLTVTEPSVVITSLQGLQEATTSTTAQDVTLRLTNIYVTAVKGTNNAYISDGTYGALIYTNNHGLEAGKMFSGTLNVKSLLYKGATEITNFSTTGLTITDGSMAPWIRTIGDITVANQSALVTFEGVTYDATAKTFSDGTNSIAYYDNFSVSPTLEDGHVYNITGIIVMYNNLQIAPLAATDVVEVTPETVELVASQDCYKTLYTPYDMDLEGSDLEAYIVTLNDEQNDATFVSVTKIPAETPVILHAATEGTYTLTRAALGISLDDVTSNELQVSDGNVTGDGTIYVLNKNPEIGFYLLNQGKTLAEGKCYLQIEKNGAKFIGFHFEGEATGIAGLESANDKLQGTVYNLAGQRVATPAHGLYIVNGKKVFIK